MKALYREGMSINHHTCSRRVGDFSLILIISPDFPTMFSFNDASDVQDKVAKYSYIMHWKSHIGTFPDRNSQPRHLNEQKQLKLTTFRVGTCD